MNINVNNLFLPKIEPNYLDSSKEIYSRIKKELSISKVNWLASLNGLGYAAYGHDNISKILKDKRWHNGLYLLSESNPHYDEIIKINIKKLIINTEGKDHVRLKKIVTPIFSPKAADSLRGEMKNAVNEIIDTVVDLEKFDLQKDVFDKYPSYIISKILGIPNSDWKKFAEWADNSFKTFVGGNNSADAEIIKKSQKELNAYTKNLIKNKKLNPSDDLVTMLINARSDEDKLTDSEIASLIHIVIMAGIDTTRYQLGLISIILLSRPDLVEMIINDKNVNEIIEECVRIDGVFKQLIRVASEDIEMNGILFPKGTLLVLAISSGQYDNFVFEDSTEFKLERKNGKSMTLAYGSGAHYCLGASLARAQMQECIKILFKRIPEISLSGEVVYKKVHEAVWGAHSIPVHSVQENRV
jgi:cytochrome P450